MTPVPIAPDDIVPTRAASAANAREPLVVLDRLVEFLDERGIGSGTPTFAPLGEGHSNVTLEVRRGDANFVLRRPPRGPLPPSAHDVAREARVVKALAGHARVPHVLAVCVDEEIVGAPFYLMEKVEGVVLSEAVPPILDGPDQRHRIASELVDALVEVHAIDWRACGLEGFGKPAGYLERQLRRFGDLWEHNRTRDLPQMDRVTAWLERHMPEQHDARVVHGDYRLGNVMYSAGAPARLRAIYDWEMSTIGDPLADLGYLCMSWSEPEDPPSDFDLSPVTRTGGFPTRAELVALYEERSGRSGGEARWYQTLALWKAVVFMEGNYRRAAHGLSDDPYLKRFGHGVVDLADRAERLALSG